MLKNILVIGKRFSSLQPLRKRGEVLKKAGENKVAQITKVDAKLKRKANENTLIDIEKKAGKKSSNKIWKNDKASYLCTPETREGKRKSNEDCEVLKAKKIR